MLFLIVLGTALWAEFYVIEDHLLVVGREWGVSQWMTRVTGDIEGFQRVRPGYWVYIALGDRVFGTNPHAWHAATLGWGVLTCYLFAVSLRRVGVAWAAIAVFVLVMMLGGAQNWIWVSLIPQETTGLAMTAVTVWAIVLATVRHSPRPWDVVAVVGMFVSGLIKESFIILIPALLLIRLTLPVCLKGLSWIESLRRSAIAVSGGLTVFVINLAIVVVIVRAQPTGYSATASGLSLASLSPAWFLPMLASAEAAGTIALALVLWGTLWLERSMRRSVLVSIALIAALWVGPQVVLYSNGLTGRYLFPTMAGVAGLIAFGLSAMYARSRLRLLGWLATVFLIPVFAKGLTETTIALTSFTAETVSTARAIRFIADNVPATQAVLIVTDSGTGYGFESTYSVPLYAGLAGSRSAFYLWPVLSRGPRSAIHITASKDNTVFKYPESMTPRDAGAMLIMDRGIPSFDPQPLNTWLAHSFWREFQFSEPYYEWKWSLPFRRQLGVVTQRMLVQWTGAVPEARPLVRVDPALAETVSVSPFLDVPPWGLEADAAKSTSLLWVGEGEAEGFAAVLAADSPLTVDLECHIQPGPSLPGARRTVEITLENAEGPQTQRLVFEGASWHFVLPLQAGANRLRLRVLDSSTIAVQPNGDARHLMALIQQVTVRRAR